MRNVQNIICFTDLKGSTSLTESLGNEEFSKLRIEYLRISKILAELSNGKYVKNIGDANMVAFNDPIDALRFSTLLQQYYEEKDCFCTNGLETRIGLVLGTVEEHENDFFGSGVNQAARVEGKSQEGEIWANEEFYKSVSTIWGSTKSIKYFENKGEYELKGITSKNNILFSFNWKQYTDDLPEEGLAKLIFEHFEKASIVATNLKISDLSRKTKII